MTIRLVVPDRPSAGDRETVRGLLAAFNAERGYPPDLLPLAVLLHDAAGVPVGGLLGQTIFEWLYVEFLFVPEATCGDDLGTRLMDAAEAIARDRGCRNAWLTTFTFQARGFYEKRGYRVFGELESSPGDNVRLFLRKVL